MQRIGKKKSKGKKGNKTRGRRKPAADEAVLDKVPFERYRIIEDEPGIFTDYLLAIDSLRSEWSDLRTCVQDIWSRVAYEGLNSAVAGILSNISLGMLSKVETEFLADFPDHDSFEAIIKTITRGDPDKAQKMLPVSLAGPPRGREGSTKTNGASDVDIREQWMMYAYQDLLDFVTDFRKTWSGKPTKAMAKTLHWDPTLDLEQASKEGRLVWRRAYTINWLYDLVNVFSIPVLQARNLRGQQIDNQSVDWSIHGPWHLHRRLYGLIEFAGEITGLEMQRPGLDVKPKIRPHMVFQLQCIVDSFCVARGWRHYGSLGNELILPAENFRPRRDIDLFMDRENERPGKGLGTAVKLQISSQKGRHDSG
ncbi:hypothetical protein BJX70DRAFT_396858 [Aspergillus crustosus]